MYQLRSTSRLSEYVQIIVKIAFLSSPENRLAVVRLLVRARMPTDYVPGVAFVAQPYRVVTRY